MSINRVSISGNLTRDPELRQTQGGTAVLSLGVAVNDRRQNRQTGQWEDVPNFVDCVMFGARAEAVSRHLSKGQKVAVEGRLRYSSWQAKDGSRRSKLEVVVDELEFMSPRQAAQAPAYDRPAYAPRQAAAAPQQVPQAPQAAAYAPQPAPAPQAPQPAPQPVPQAAPDLYDVDIPF